MIVFAVKENGAVVGYSLTANMAQEEEEYSQTPLVLEAIAEASEEVARNIADYLTYVKDSNAPYNLPSTYNIPDNGYTLTPAGEAVWPNLFIGD